MKRLNDLSKVYENFIAEHGTNLGEFYTPEVILEIIQEELKGVEIDKIYDPSCGMGNLLYTVEANEYHGQEINAKTAEMCQAFGEELGLDVVIHTGDTLNEPQTEETFKYILANPPYGLDSRETEYNCGASGSELAFVEHCLDVWDDSGKMIFVMPRSYTTKATSMKWFKKNVDLVSKIIFLPSNLFTNTTIKTMLVIFEKGHDTIEVINYEQESNQ